MCSLLTCPIRPTQPCSPQPPQASRQPLLPPQAIPLLQPHLSTRSPPSAASQQQRQQQPPTSPLHPPRSYVAQNQQRTPPLQLPTWRHVQRLPPRQGRQPPLAGSRGLAPAACPWGRPRRTQPSSRHGPARRKLRLRPGTSRRLSARQTSCRSVSQLCCCCHWPAGCRGLVCPGSALPQPVRGSTRHCPLIQTRVWFQP